MRRIRHFFTTLTLILITTISFAQEVDLSQYRWTAVETSGNPKARHENTFIEYKGKFYLMGGRGVNPVDVYDPETKMWETKGKTPFEFHHFQPVVYGDAIYIVCAMTGQYPKETPLENVWIYYPETDKWEKSVEIPEARRRGGAGAVVYKDKIYVACGIDYGHTSGTNNNFDAFDPKTGEWEILTKAPHIRDHFPAIVVGDKLYLVGGRNSSFHLKGRFTAFFGATMPYVDVYDFEAGTWITLEETLPVPTAAGGLMEFEGKILYMGGEGNYASAYNLTQAMDLETGKWEQLAPMTTGRHGSGAILYKNDIYIAAGSPNKGGGNLNTLEVFSAKHDWKPLFNGKDLSGWEVKCTDADKGKGYWRVENGTILCDTKGKKDHNYMWLYSDEEFSDFELRLKFQATRDHKGNSGVQVRSRFDEKAEVEKGVKGWLDGPQVDIEPNNPWRNGFIYDETRTAKRWINPSLPDWNIDKEKYAPKKVVYNWADQGTGWNDMTIICKGNQITTYVNNVKVSDYDGTGVLDDKGHKKHKVGSKGHIAIQLHKNSVNFIRFKDIEIREL
ncbi:family 16 glycoside hydrolase [Flammeovirgaceae bacterium SG7u.111]|nr:family 16 glycoside hydrolase [Flammeovirgaceae bacterium SG7u.132]WPO37312.1 family 16 glycoside hydrolase [Flammeovirgaceae bacterium SG7u.111]